MVIIRLSRGGAKKKPFYHVVVTDNRNKRDGRYIERVGYYNPCAVGKDIPIHLDVAKIDEWVNKHGAALSDRVAKILSVYKAAAKDSKAVAAENATSVKSKTAVEKPKDTTTKAKTRATATKAKAEGKEAKSTASKATAATKKSSSKSSTAKDDAAKSDSVA